MSHFMWLLSYLFLFSVVVCTTFNTLGDSSKTVIKPNFIEMLLCTIIWCLAVRCLLFVCLYDLPVKGARQTTARGCKHQAGNSQSLSSKHWSNAYDCESRSYDSVTRRRHFLVIIKPAVSFGDSNLRHPCNCKSCRLTTGPRWHV